MTTTAPAPAPAEDDSALDGGDALEAPLPPIKHRRKLGPLTFVLALVFVAAAGFLLGVGAEHRHDADNPPDNPLAALLAGRGAAGAATGAGAGGATGAAGRAGRGGGGGGGGAPAQGATGTVKLVDGDKLYLQESDGTVVKYVIQPDTQIGQLAPAATQSLQPGVTLTVTGSQTADDATVAQVITVDGAAAPSPSG